MNSARRLADQLGDLLVTRPDFDLTTSALVTIASALADIAETLERRSPHVTVTVGDQVRRVLGPAEATGIVTEVVYDCLGQPCFIKWDETSTGFHLVDTPSNLEAVSS